ncbi:MAG: hypothetical protein J5766_05370 [Clostridia bacterium]|nr:hypothetical protein [Clostridia bacterium]
MKKRISAFLICVLLCLSAVGCGKGAGSAKVAPLKFGKVEKNNPDSFVASENDNFSLKWDSKNKRVEFFDKEKNRTFSYLPDEAMEVRYDADGYEVINHPQIISPINITIFDKSKNIFDKIIGHNGSDKKNEFSVSKTNGGISITFYFEKQQISVQVDYLLRDDSILIKIDPKKIAEGDKYMLTSVSVAPFLCSVKNKTDDSYLFVPSGCGALVYADEEKADAVDVSDEMYGIGSREPDDSAIKTLTADLTMPVFGAKNGDKGMLAIIEGGTESTSLRINTGNSNIGYSAVYADFDVRSHTTLYKNEDWGSVNKFSNELTTNTLAIGYYPLYGDKADYVGMAEKYREYLLKNGMKKSGEEERMINLEILGGTKVTESALGVPYDTVYATTTVKQAEKIITEIADITKEKPVVQLCGFGDSGLDIGKIAGDLKLNGSIGSTDDLKNLSKKCLDKNIGLYFDYDALQYKENSSLASFKNDSALAVNDRNIRLKYYYSWCGTVDSTGKGWNNNSNFTLIKRSLIPGILGKITGSADNFGLKGISLSTLGSIAYSDNSEQKYYSKGQMPEQVYSQIKKIKESGKKVLLSNANAYAAMAADYVLDSPSKSSQYDFMDEDVPFYQIVFKGTIPLASSPLAMSGDVDKAILKAVETGTGLTFAMSYNYTNKLIDNADVRYFGSDYQNAKSLIKNAVDEYKDYFDAVKGARIVDHCVVEKNIVKTQFDNGVTVYVNYSDKDYDTPFGTVKAKSHIYSVGGERS